VALLSKGGGLLKRFEVAILSHNPAGAGKARGPLRAWQAWERISNRIHPSSWIGPGGTVGVRKELHRGRNVTLRDGTVIHPGDTLLEVHLNNARLSEVAAASAGGHWDALRAAKRDIRWLMEEVREGGFGEVHALHGFTQYGLAARWAGFEMREARAGLKSHLDHFFMRGLARIYEPGTATAPRPVRAGPRPFDVWWVPSWK
jgi:hypothetical protein